MLSSYIKFIQLLTKALVYLQILRVYRLYSYIYLYYIDTTVYFITYTKYYIYYILVGIQQVASCVCVCVHIYIYEILYRYQSISIFKHQDSNIYYKGFPGSSDGKESALQCRRPEFDPWVGKMPWRRAWQPTSVFLPGEPPWTEEPGGLQSMGS